MVDAETKTTRAPDDPALAPTELAEGHERGAPRKTLPPSLLARYEALELIGEGGMGVVYRARDPRLRRPVAIKLIKGEDPELCRRFIQEAHAQARVEHDHVCRVYEAGEADGEPYIVMQLIDGAPLSRLRGTLPLEQGVKLVREVALAVHEAHRQGLIHRDLKPQNILIEKAEDGALRPYVVDFGLAREVAERGQTVTGAVVGTPAYMPPEQALGDVRSMDRRSDVYSLGATLYDLVAGRPPFVAEHPWKLLMMAAYEDAPSLGAMKRGVPADLETIVARCLERDPTRRYDSARALADDLGRFLDGEAISAKRASLGYVAWKKLKKHRLATAMALAALLSALGFGGVWAKGRRDAAEQARLAQALGEDVKGMELFLRTAYGLPLHDVERERAIVRQKLAQIEQTMAAAGRVGEGPGHYARGRGHLALGDPGSAREELAKARAAGYSSAAVDAALGQALGELFLRAVEATKRITNAEERKKRISALEIELRDPALAHLRAGRAAETDAPLYVEGLIALYEGKHEEALDKARRAFLATPWLYEAKKLEGDALYAMGNPFRHDAAFAYDTMIAHFRPAAEAYRAAAEIARSDPEVHRAECELWEKIGWADVARGAPALGDFETADAACGRAVAASRDDGRAAVQRALVLAARGSRLTQERPESALPVLDEAVRAAEAAVRRSPGEVMAVYASARALSHRAELLHNLGREVDIAPAIAAFQRAIALDPQFTWAVNELGDAEVIEADVDRRNGRDPAPALLRAAQHFERAEALDPAFTMPIQKRVRVHVYRVQDELDRGASSEASLGALFGALDAMKARMGSSLWAVTFYSARAFRLRGAHELDQGRDPTASIEAALAAIQAHAERGPLDAWLLSERAECHLLGAVHASIQGHATAPRLSQARAALAELGRDESAVDDDARALAARVELLALRDALARGSARAETFEAALAPLLPSLSKPAFDPGLCPIAAEIHARRALWLAHKAQDPTPDLERGRALAEQALAKNPHLPSALAARGLLALAEAEHADGASRRASAQRAREAFESAFRENPRLARDYQAESRALASLLAR
jgi:tetratricopeptide (TPR) repeat protein